MLFSYKHGQISSLRQLVSLSERLSGIDVPRRVVHNLATNLKRSKARSRQPSPITVTLNLKHYYGGDQAGRIAVGVGLREAHFSRGFSSLRLPWAKHVECSPPERRPKAASAQVHAVSKAREAASASDAGGEHHDDPNGQQEASASAIGTRGTPHADSGSLAQPDPAGSSAKLKKLKASG